MRQKKRKNKLPDTFYWHLLKRYKWYLQKYYNIHGSPRLLQKFIWSVTGYKIAEDRLIKYLKLLKVIDSDKVRQILESEIPFLRRKYKKYKNVETVCKCIHVKHGLIVSSDIMTKYLREFKIRE